MDQEGIKDRSQAIGTNTNRNFETLAPELLLPILTQLSDLESLDNLLQVSPAASRLFNLRGVEIFETVLSSDPNIHEYTRALIRIVALLRSTALPPCVHDFTSLRNVIRQETTSYRYEPSTWDHPPLSLPPYTSTVALRDVLTTHQKIKRLTFDCIQFYLDKFKRLRPCHLADDTFVYGSSYDSDGNYFGPWQQEPVEVPYPVRDIGPPTWIEQQRVLRALWRIRLFHELKYAIGTLCITWITKDVSSIRNMTLEMLYDVPRVVWTDEETCAYSLQEDREDSVPRVGIMKTLLEYELIYSVEDFLQEGRKTINESTYQRLKLDWASFRVPANKNEWYDDDIDDIHCSPMWRMYFDLAGDTIDSSGSHMANFMSPLQHIAFTPFRHLGFAVWSQARLQGYGLQPISPPLGLDGEVGYIQPGKYASVYAAWRSILTADERSESERKNKLWDSTITSRQTEEEARNAYEEFEDMQARAASAFSRLYTEAEEEELGPPVVDWAEHYRREKKRIYCGMEIGDEGENFAAVAEDDEISECAGTTTGL